MPRIALLLLAGGALFVLASLVYVWPVLREPAPAGAIPDWHAERVRARLQGKVPWLLVGSFGLAGVLGARWLRAPSA